MTTPYTRQLESADLGHVPPPGPELTPRTAPKITLS